MIKKVLIISLILFGFTLMPKECLAEESAKLEQAEAYVDNSEYEQAEIIYKTIVQDYPGTDDALEGQKGLTILYISWDKPAQADAAFDKLLAEFSGHPDIAEAVNDIADTYLSVQKYEKARELHQHVIENWSDSEAAVWSQADLAISNIGLGDDTAAETAIEKLIAEFSEHKDIADAVNETADTYLSVQKYEKARELFQYVLDNWPSNEEAMWSQVGLAISNIGLGDDTAAETAIEKLLTDFSDRPNMAQAVHDLADNCIWLGKFEKARELFQYVIENWPGSEVVIHCQAGLARYYIATGDDPNAQAGIDSLIADFNEHPDLSRAIYRIGEEYYMKALQLEHQGLDTEARDYFAKAIAVSEKVIKELLESTATADAYYLLAACYQQLDEYEKAVDCCREIVDSWPDYKYMWDVKHTIIRCQEQLEK